MNSLNSGVHTNNPTGDILPRAGFSKGLHLWLIGLLLRHGGGDAPASHCLPSTSCRTGERRQLICKQPISTLPFPTCHMYIFQPRAPPPHCPNTHTHQLTPRPRCHASWYHFLWGSKFTQSSFVSAFATHWTFINPDRITAGTGCTGTGLGHTQWVGKAGKKWGEGMEEKKKFSSFNLD